MSAALSNPPADFITLSRDLFAAAGGILLLAVVIAAVAMLGPGARSIDARRFGRQRFDL